MTTRVALRLELIAVVLGASALLVATSLFLSEHDPSSPAVYVLAPGAVVAFALSGGRAHDDAFVWLGLLVNVVFYAAVGSIVAWLVKLRVEHRR